MQDRTQHTADYYQAGHNICSLYQKGPQRLTERHLTPTTGTGSSTGTTTTSSSTGTDVASSAEEDSSEEYDIAGSEDCSEEYDIAGVSLYHGRTTIN
ncbi:hypothetical protein PC116_g11468 [Phytophthora cactorum]|uniref:Uncharacterized protein n=1 Tax=Phytophthora cactorum TaxID=29920 RepID=A0A8T0ZC76_9STRA|nr:hypothetical protein Pcac1_g11115 [Phytophthora cactorum]KAG2859885.1 hypothetical protein PC113_g8528 [Phytophthora cactorum]KAG2945058.1 hypothetical protein PC117_g8769 [Phytophthora cactorum]KAG3175657.1 hypothetical protein C6341_g9354 [Phytophthora cactorum]KAG4240542.1 hypothetical protein PC116_g11468 [Phytophthora cactorum]